MRPDASAKAVAHLDQEIILYTNLGSTHYIYYICTLPQALKYWHQLSPQLCPSLLYCGCTSEAICRHLFGC
jgi:hypothetical protein